MNRKMHTTKTPSGITSVGSVKWGSHFCLLYRTTNDLADQLRSYFKAGLDNNEYCLCIVSEMNYYKVKEILESLSSERDLPVTEKQLEIQSCGEWYFGPTGFDMNRIVEQLHKKEEDALAAGLSGMRVISDVSWLVSKRWGDYFEYEKQTEHLTDGHKIISLCVCEIASCDAIRTIDLIGNHDFAVVVERGQHRHIQTASQQAVTNEIDKSGMLLSSVFDSIQDLILVVDRDLRVVMSNWKEHEYISDSEKLGRPHCYEVFMHRDSPCEVCHALEVFNTGAGKELEFVNTVDNRIKNIRVTPVFDERSNVVVAVEHVRDISRQKEAEESHRKSSEYLEFLFKTIPNVMYTVDLDRKITSWNSYAERVTGLSGEDVIGKKCTEIWYCPQCEAKCGLYANDVAKPIVGRECNIIIGKKRFSVSKNVDVLRNKEGEIVGGIEVCEDITERKHSAQKLTQANEKLAEHDRLKNDLIMTVTHELWTPLTIFKSILSNALANAYGRISGRLRKNLDAADETIDRLSRIVSDFTDIMKFDSGAAEVHLTELDMKLIVNETANYLTSIAKGKGLDIELELSHEALSVNGDAKYIKQVLTNLVTNAIRFTPEIGGQIIIRAKRLDGEVIVEVEDNGRGISSNDIDKVFSRFVQITKQAGLGSHGMGLGLTICKEIIEIHGGRIWVESVPGERTVFCFALPEYGSTGINGQSCGTLEEKSAENHNLTLK